MKIKRIYLVAIIQLFIIIGLVLYIINLYKKDIPITEVINTHTDTTIVKDYFKPIKPLKNITLPTTIIEYRPIKVEDKYVIKSLKLKITQDSLEILGLKEKLSLHQDYIKLYPKNPKLISLSLSQKLLTLSLLQTDGIIRDYNYNLFLDGYKYHWLSNQMTLEYNRPNIKRNPMGIYLGTSSTINNFDPLISVRAEKQWARKRIYLGTSLGLLSTERSRIEFGLEYNLIGK